MAPPGGCAWSRETTKPHRRVPARLRREIGCAVGHEAFGASCGPCPCNVFGARLHFAIALAYESEEPFPSESAAPPRARICPIGVRSTWVWTRTARFTSPLQSPSWGRSWAPNPLRQGPPAAGSRRVQPPDWMRLRRAGVCGGASSRKYSVELRASGTQAGRVSVREAEALLTRPGGVSRLPRRFRFLGCVGRYGQDALAP